MRIIGGELKGRKLFRPEDEGVRPTSDKVRGAIFSTIAPDIVDAAFLDGFAGSGAMGIEAVSRGAKHATFLDINPKSIALTKKNVYNCHIEDKCCVLKLDFFKFLDETTAKFDIIFIDPPYAMAEIGWLPKKVEQADILKKEGILIVEHDSGVAFSDVKRLHLIKTKKYANTTITYFMRSEE